MDFGDSDYDDVIDTSEGAPPEESSNRNFILIAGALGAVAVLALLCLGVYALVLLPRNNALRAQQAAALETQSAELDAEVTRALLETATADMLAQIQSYTATPTNTATPEPTVPSTPTSVVVVAPTDSVPTLTLPAAQATATALHATLTQNALLLAGTSTASVLGATSTAAELSKTGFADEVGLPLLIGLSFLLVVVIFLARRLRTA
jgi:hypothetical protein